MNREGLHGVKRIYRDLASAGIGYREWIRRYDTLAENDRRLILEHIGRLGYRPTTSVLMPVYNPPADFLRKAIDSVRRQLYPNWEPCIADDECIDLHITQDVMEHVFNSDAAFREIARTLKPGGAHVFTVPIVNKHSPSQVRAQLGADGKIVHLMPPIYHGNPVNAEGALVTVDWGFDICQRIFDASGLFTHIVHLDDLSHGIRAEYIEVLVSIKHDTARPEAMPNAAATSPA